MKESVEIIPIGSIQQLILEIRGIKTIIDADLTKFYGVETKRLNEFIIKTGYWAKQESRT